MKNLIRILLLTFLWNFCGGFCFAAEKPQALQGIDITERLGQQLTLDQLNFVDDKGKASPLSRFFKGGKPVILTLVYYQCPMLCNLVLNGVLDAVKKVDWNLGNQFEIVTVSINPNEGPELASKKKSSYLKSYNRAQSELGWHFLTGDETNIQSLASQVGFKYRFDPKEQQYIHAAAIYIITPEGKISRYLYGTTFKPQNLKISLLEASNGKIAASTLDRFLLFCYHFDPTKNSYTLKMWRIVQFVLGMQALALVGGLTYLWRKDRSRAS
jgi:protein SCO1/2